MNYEKIYNQIINSGKNRIIIGYSEKHHIIPKCNGGDNSKENLVSLTAKEHFICHKLLCEIYPENNKLKYAYWLMCNVKNKYQERNYKVSSREYSELKLKLGIIRSKETNNRLGIKHTTESINKIKIARAKQVFSDETKKKLSDLRKGKIGNKNFKHTEESKKKMSDSKGLKCIINGIFFNSISKAAKYFNINPNTLRYKISKSENNEIILNQDKIKINGIEFNTISEASIYFNIPESTISYRIKNGIGLTSESKTKKVNCEIDGIIYKSIGEAVKLLNIPENTLRYRLKSDSFPNYKLIR